MRTVDGKNLKRLIIDPTDPARDVTGFSVPVIAERISIGGESSLPCGKLFQPAEREPRLITKLLLASHRRQEVTHDRHRQKEADNAVKKHSQFHKSCASRYSVFCAH